MLFRNNSLKTIILYQTGQVSPRSFDTGDIADSTLYPSARNHPAFAPYTPPKPKPKPEQKLQPTSNDMSVDIQAIASAYQNLVVHMSKMKSDVLQLINEIQNLKDELELMKTPPIVDELYKNNDIPIYDIHEEEVEIEASVKEAPVTITDVEKMVDEVPIEETSFPKKANRRSKK